MLDDSQDPTPLLKEIRDDKTATIIVDANATMSHTILERVWRFLTANDLFISTFIFLLCFPVKNVDIIILTKHNSESSLQRHIFREYIFSHKTKIF